MNKRKADNAMPLRRRTDNDLQNITQKNND